MCINIYIYDYNLDTSIYIGGFDVGVFFKVIPPHVLVAGVFFMVGSHPNKLVTFDEP